MTDCKFKVGDKVRLIEDYDRLKKGYEFVIKDQPSRHYGEKEWLIDIPGTGGIYAKRLEKVVEKFNAGDKVRYLGGYSPANTWFDKGDILTVEAVHDNYLHIRPTKGAHAGHVGAFVRSYFELVPQPVVTLSGYVDGTTLVLPNNIRLPLPPELIPVSEEFKELKDKLIKFARKSSRTAFASRIERGECDNNIKEVFGVR